MRTTITITVALKTHWVNEKSVEDNKGNGGDEDPLSFGWHPGDIVTYAILCAM